MGLRKQKWLNPKLSVFFGAFNVNMDRLFGFPTEEEKTVSMVTKDLGHTGKLLTSTIVRRRGLRFIPGFPPSLSLHPPTPRPPTPPD